jgi:hypothetical protein
MASEDSDQILSGFAMVHRLRELSDLDQPFSGQMPIRSDYVHAFCELLEVQSLRSPQRMSSKERNDHVGEIVPPADDVLKQVLLVIVVPLVLVDPTHSEEISDLLETAGASSSLRHDETVEHLVPGRVAAPLGPIRLPNEANGEATFSVYKTENPAKSDQSFLLIVRTRHVFTMVNARSDVYEVVRDTRIFQHIARCFPHSYLRGGQRMPSGTSKKGHVPFGLVP